ncbi:hypothetical protein [Methanosarcina barkeri]|nr:hypothetical protein [Methanosarcina barkeri]
MAQMETNRAKVTLFQASDYLPVWSACMQGRNSGRSNVRLG